MNNNSILKAIGLAGQGQRFPALSLVKDDPATAAVIAKLVSPLAPSQHNNQGQRVIQTPNTPEMRQVGHRTARNIQDASMVMQLLPDMELSAQILVSSILSPKDMMSTELVFTAPEGVVNAQAMSEMLAHIRRHFEQVYKIKPKLSGILRDALFDKGSHIIAVIPENSIDEVINRHTAVTMESVRDLLDENGQIRPLGILGSPTAPARARSTAGMIAVEDFQEYSFQAHQSNVPVRGQIGGKGEALDLGIVVSDNPNLLKYPKVQEKLRSQRLKSAIQGLNRRRRELDPETNTRLMRRLSLESYGDRSHRLNDREMSSALYKRTHTNADPVVVMKPQNQLVRTTIGNPLIMELPSESVIPVHVPGQVDKHIGYFVLLDQSGHPMSSSTDKDYYTELQQRMAPGPGGSYSSTLLTRITSMTQGFDCSNRSHIDYSMKVYADMVEQDLLARLRNGIYPNGVALARNEEVYRIMLARALEQKQTQLLFLPVELVTYFAFRYNGDGVGKSLLDDMKVLNSLRAMLLFSNTMASIRNSVGLTNVRLKLDPEDPDPEKSIERVMNEIVRAKQQSFPLGTNSPTDLVNYLQRAGFQWLIEGHPGLPDMNIEQTETNTSYAKPDTELEDSLRKRAIMATGLNPETVDNGFSGEFATSVVANNVLLSRRIMQLQEQFTPQLSDHVQKVIFSSQSLMDQLEECLHKNFEDFKFEKSYVESVVGKDNPRMVETMVEHLLNDFVRGIEATLPRPNTVTLENQFTALESFVKLLDPMLDAYISDAFFTDNLVGETAGKASEIKALLRAYFIRQWAAENGVLPELSDITATDENDKPKIDFWQAQQSHLEAVMKALGALVTNVEKVKEETGELVQDHGGDPNAAGAPSTSDEGGDSLTDPFASDLGGGLDDLGTGSDSDEAGSPEASETPADGDAPEQAPGPNLNGDDDDDTQDQTPA